MTNFEQLRLRAALQATRLQPKLRRAIRLVFLHGRTQSQAARTVGANRRHVNRAVLIVRVRLAEVDAYIRESVRTADEIRASEKIVDPDQ